MLTELSLEFSDLTRVDRTFSEYSSGQSSVDHAMDGESHKKETRKSKELLYIEPTTHSIGYKILRVDIGQILHCY